MINNISNNSSELYKVTQKASYAEVSEKNTQNSSADAQNNQGEQVTLGAGKDAAVVYNKPLSANQQITLKFQVLQQLVSSLTVSQGAVAGKSTQGQSVNDVISQLFNKLNISTTIDVGDGKTADLTTMTPEEAQKLVADDGYLGVEQTSQRIVDFASAQIASDPSKFDKVKDAIMSGFNAAKDAFGGKLPDISQKTIDAVMEKLDKLKP